MRLVAVSWRGEFFAQDPTDGFLVPVGHTGFTRINSLTVTPDDRVLCIAEREDANPVVIEIDPDTGRGAEVCVLDAMVDARALAAAPSGVLYGVIVRPDAYSRCTFVEINPRTGHIATLIDTGWIGIQSLECCPHGDLFAVVNPYTTNGVTRPGLVLRVDAIEWSMRKVAEIPDCPSVQSIAFDECDIGHISWRENKAVHTGANPIALTGVDTETNHITIDETVWNIEGADIRGIGFLHLHRWWELCGTDGGHGRERTPPAPPPSEELPR